jgi:hypothetical protein
MNLLVSARKVAGILPHVLIKLHSVMQAGDRTQKHVEGAHNHTVLVADLSTPVHRRALLVGERADMEVHAHRHGEVLAADNLAAETTGIPVKISTSRDL